MDRIEAWIIINNAVKNIDYKMDLSSITEYVNYEWFDTNNPFHIYFFREVLMNNYKLQINEQLRLYQYTWDRSHGKLCSLLLEDMQKI